jgi:hypothetical protein
MPIFTFVAYVEVPVEANSIDEAIDNFNNLNLKHNIRFTGVKEIKSEDGVPIDRPLKGGAYPIQWQSKT